MAWESRRGRGCYFTVTVRRPGRRVRIYFGNGPAAEMAATLLELRAVDRQLRRQAAREKQQHWAALEAELRRFWQGVGQLAHASLVVAGYRLHHRGEWRRGRELLDFADESPPLPAPQEDLPVLIYEAEQGHHWARARLRYRLHTDFQVWHESLALGQQLEAALIALVAGDNPSVAADLRKQVEDQKTQLLKDGESILERLLVLRVAVCWLRAAHLGGLVTQQADPSSRSRKELQERKRHQVAQRRHARALRALDTVRALLQRAQAG